MITEKTRNEYKKLTGLQEDERILYEDIPQLVQLELINQLQKQNALLEQQNKTLKDIEGNLRS